MKSSGRNFQTKGQIGLQGSRLERWIDNNLQYLLLAPAVAILLFLTIYPTIRLITLCFYEYDFMNPADSKFVGLKNFTRLFTDSRFHQSLGNTLKFTIVVVSVEFILGLGLALLFSRVLRGTVGITRESETEHNRLLSPILETRPRQQEWLEEDK